eukprot:NODE_1318_length_969_cov_190.303261_g1013_i0.p1 GENE.NODE_1318_length_969_cov_190.303261_g1013_i0~~NODE_1318_length_969_cov_190.303261_g1013_i0.p1  ORF type:complete len:268 (-),score=46.51 NODE_1318_length_969_cov_190.303261_g1013_i0:74-877(-)
MGNCHLDHVTFAVLDEADRMLDSGFEWDVRSILALLHPQNRQTVMFSATWPNSVRQLAAEFMDRPIKIVIGNPELTANVRIRQTVEVITPHQKDSRLLELMRECHRGGNRVIVFVLRKREAPHVEDLLHRLGCKVGALHGNCKQNQRNKALAQFRTGKIPVLVATDVAGRGLDVDDVEHVINYSLPTTIADYVHRIGRTARAGKKGCAHTFYCQEHDKALAWDLARILREAEQEVPPELACVPRSSEETCNISTFKPSAKIVFEDSD